MKLLISLLFSILLLSCFSEKSKLTETNKKLISKRLTSPALQSILDSAVVNGAILIFDEQANQYVSNDFVWSEKGQLPASTFKIPNSIIAFETGVVAEDSTLFKWDGQSRSFKVWEQDLSFRDAFKYSCVPCYQEVARGIGVERMKGYIAKFNYGNIQVDSSSLDLFWLSGSSTITPFQQIDFLKRFYHGELSISKQTEERVKSMMILTENDEFILSGKTGWSVNGDKNNGWFVGYVEVKNKVYYFATNVEPKPSFDMALFPKIRKEVTYQAFRNLEIVK